MDNATPLAGYVVASAYERYLDSSTADFGCWAYPDTGAGMSDRITRGTAMSDDDEDVHRIELRAQTVEELRSFLDGAADLDLGCRPAVRRQPSGELVVEVYATMPQLDRLRA